jgi:GntR family transcriptional regulator
VRDGQPFLLGDTYIDERVCAHIPRAAFKTKTALKLINDVPGMKIGDAQQTLTIGTADIAVAETLGLPLNAPIAKVDLCVVDSDGTLVLAGYGIYRGDVVRIDTKLV